MVTSVNDSIVTPSEMVSCDVDVLRSASATPFAAAAVGALMNDVTTTLPAVTFTRIDISLTRSKEARLVR